MVGQYCVRRMDWIRSKLISTNVELFCPYHIYAIYLTFLFKIFKDYQRKYFNQSKLIYLDKNFSILTFLHVSRIFKISPKSYLPFPTFPSQPYYYSSFESEIIDIHRQRFTTIKFPPTNSSWKKKKAIIRTPHDRPHPFLLNIYSRRPRSSPPIPKISTRTP